MFIIFIFYIFNFFDFTLSFSNIPIYRQWNPIAITNNNNFIDNKPFKFNVGDIPLVAWESNNSIISTLNICKHMGSKLDDAFVCNGNLICPYHGLKHNIDDSCGIIKKYDGKLWWSYNPVTNNPPTIPFNLPNYKTSYLQIDMDESLPFCIYNSLDINHPEFVHNGLGFGSDQSPENYKTYFSINKAAISFDYVTKDSIKAINYDMNINDKTLNYNEVIYPLTSWSKISSNNDIQKNIIIGVSMLPLKENLTRWFITIRHNYMTDFIGQQIMIGATKYILNQDKQQFLKQSNNEKLKKFMCWKKTLRFENHMSSLREYYENYKYPNLDDFIKELSNDKW